MIFVLEDIKKWYESKDQKQTISELLGSRKPRSEQERVQAPARRILIDSLSVAMTESGEDFQEIGPPPQERENYIFARYRKMEGADIVDMVEKDRTNSRRAGELISKISKCFKDATSKPRWWEKKASISTPTEFERQCSSMKNRPEVDQVDLSCQSKGRKENNEVFQGKIANHRDRVQHRCRSVAKRLVAACDNLCVKQKRVAVRTQAIQTAFTREGQNTRASPKVLLDVHQTTCKDLTKYSKNYSSRARVEKDVTTVTKTAANNDFSYFSSLATMTEKKGKLVSTSKSSVVRITKDKIVSHASKQGEEDIGIIFHEIGGESPPERERRYESFKDHQSYPHTERKIEAVCQQGGALQLERARDQDETKGAYALDSQIQKWSHGKEGNLRALLSTLDNVLWPGCNWKMVRASELVMASSVKTVYRKATFCLHPDKVQQRGGTIEQKYVAQIVFGILREAWNKFQREELG